MAEHSLNHNEALNKDEFSTVSQAGWNRFGKFLLVNVIVAIVTLLLIGLFTVWA